MGIRGWRQIHERRVLLVVQESRLANQQRVELVEGTQANADSPSVVPIKVVSHRGNAGHVNDRDGAAESDKGKGVAQWGEE